jgi:hypothetical protein
MAAIFPRKAFDGIKVADRELADHRRRRRSRPARRSGSQRALKPLDLSE